MDANILEKLQYELDGYIARISDVRDRVAMKLEKVKELFLIINEQIQPEVIFSLNDLYVIRLFSLSTYSRLILE